MINLETQLKAIFEDYTFEVDLLNFNIRVMYDQDPINPFKDLYDLPDLISISGGHITEYSIEYDFECLPTLTREEIKANLPAIKKLFGFDPNLSLLYVMRTIEDPLYWHHYNCQDNINHFIQDLYAGLNKSEKIDLYSEILTLKGINNITGTKTGYVQGDYIQYIIIQTDEHHNVKTLESAIDLYSSWAFGDCFGYVITDKITGKQISSCWGFYGYRHLKSGLYDCVLSDIGGEILRYKQYQQSLETAQTI